ncbi:MAG TPA: Rpn family recombination-promoting nuclease/putative transposase, partial [Gemmataceae bacterium]|nr:Rpn family recombination-promoting nuclease/putative transposase [Gemmataceae bacterium]
YYWAKLHQGHLTEGQDYAELRPTVSIVFVNEPLFPELPHWHSIFELRERQTGTIFSDQLQLHVVEIPKFSLSAQELRTPLEAWIYFLKHSVELDTDRLPPALHGPSYEQALKQMTQMTQSELERERYESRLKAQRDFAAAVQEARNKGLVEGLIREIHLCQRLLGQPLTPSDALRALSMSAVEQLAKALEEQVAHR